MYPILAMLFLFAFSPLQAKETLTWQQCVSEARTAHPDLYSALAILQQAEADKRITAGSLFPQLSLAVSSYDSGTTAKNGTLSPALSYSLSVKQLLYD